MLGNLQQNDSSLLVEKGPQPRPPQLHPRQTSGPARTQLARNARGPHSSPRDAAWGPGVRGLCLCCLFTVSSSGMLHSSVFQERAYVSRSVNGPGHRRALKGQVARSGLKIRQRARGVGLQRGQEPWGEATAGGLTQGLGMAVQDHRPARDRKLPPSSPVVRKLKVSERCQAGVLHTDLLLSVCLSLQTNTPGRGGEPHLLHVKEQVGSALRLRFQDWVRCEESLDSRSLNTSLDSDTGLTLRAGRGPWKMASPRPRMK